MRKLDIWLWIPLLMTISACSGGKDADDTGGASNCLPFAPSNLPEDIGCDSTEELVLSSENCSGYVELCFNTDDGFIGHPLSGSCYSECSSMDFGFQVVEQSDLSEVAVFTASSIRVDPTISVYVSGQRPLVLVANETIEVLGTITAIPDYYVASGGGFTAPESEGKGTGLGGGGAVGESFVGGGGGGYCGVGGDGGLAADPVGVGGVSNGSAEIIPLRGGSSGASTGVLSTGGGGGGAIELVAGDSIQVTDLGVIHVGGAGGQYMGAGGGAGGAILLESQAVVMAGTLASNGGGGGGGVVGGGGSVPTGGTAGQANSSAANGGVGGINSSADTGGDGGPGSAGQTTEGGVGGDGTGGQGGGGGGGAGWIRINTTSGAADITGTLSPEPGDCASEGSVTPQ